MLYIIHSEFCAKDTNDEYDTADLFGIEAEGVSYDYVQELASGLVQERLSDMGESLVEMLDIWAEPIDSDEWYDTDSIDMYDTYGNEI